MERLANYVVHHRRIVIGVWILLTAFGAFSAGQVADRWLEDFSIPGASGYEADQRALAKLGNGELYPFVIALSADEDVTKVPGVEEAIAKTAAANPGSRVSSFFNTGDDVYVSEDRKVTFANIYGAGQFSFEGVDIEPTEKALAAALPEGVEGYVTGVDALYAEASETTDETEPPSVLAEALIGGIGALVILLFTFGTLPAIAMPLLIAIASILNTFSLIWLMTYVTDVSIIVQFLVALVGLGVAIDYALLMIFRFREELRHGADRDKAIVQTMRHAGRSVIVSGSTVASRAAEHDSPAAPVHPLDRDRRNVDPGGLGADLDHAPAGAALHARPADQQPSRDATAPRRGKRRSGQGLLEQVGAFRRAPAAPGRSRRPRRSSPRCSSTASSSTRATLR